MITMISVLFHDNDDNLTNYENYNYDFLNDFFLTVKGKKK